MRCPVCKEKVNELDEVCPNCKTNFDEYEEHEKKYTKEFKNTNADRLNFMAYINLVLSIVGAIAIWVNFSTIEYKATSKYATSITEINWYGIFGGIGILIVGFTLFFLLKTVADIYWEVGK